MKKKDVRFYCICFIIISCVPARVALHKNMEYTQNFTKMLIVQQLLNGNITSFVNVESHMHR